MAVLSDRLETVLGAKVAETLSEEIKVFTVGHLVHYFPSRYVRQGALSPEKLPDAGERVTVVARIERADVVNMRQRRGQMLKIVANDGHNKFTVTFFNPRFIRNRLKAGVRVMLSGEVSYFRDQLQLTHPEWMVLPDDGMTIETGVGSAELTSVVTALRDRQDVDAADAPEGRYVGDSDDGGLDLADFDRALVPVYPATRKLQTWDIWSHVRTVLKALEPVPDPLPESARAERGFIDEDTALRTVHFPETEDEVAAARERLKFDEAFALQVALAERRHADRDQRAPSIVHVPGALEDKLAERLPFTLTGGQQVVINEIYEQLALPRPMSRLLQGEVGSGKTLVSLLTMLRAVDNGYQCVLLAPTEVLAAQHYRTITTQLGGLAKAGELEGEPGATRVALLTGSMKTAGKRTALLEVVSGDAGIVIGTHALLEEHVDFFNLGYVVVDEQHRFGVEQRDVLRGRGRDDVVPHLLVMTATPIPRTVAMTVYGDLETSTLRELPRGRQPITTTVVPTRLPSWVERVWQRVDEEVEAGRQVYVVCSRIGDDPDVKPKSKKKSGDGKEEKTVAVVDLFAQLSAGPLGKRRIAMLHGRMPGDEKNAIMDAFTTGEIDILVSTTVIEVGVDVPNATTMVIVDAERFGVSQLHQLRGRVGRGGLPGLCLLMTGAPEVSQSMERLKAVEKSNDGFELARVDLAQRREGDVLGAAQSGETSSLHFLSLLEDDDIIADARDLADALLATRSVSPELVDQVLGSDRAGYLDKS